MPKTQATDIAVIGGGLAGLAAATFLARAGRTVTLFEKAREVGGRAVTHTQGDFRFNLGPHALYRAGRGVQVLREWAETAIPVKAACLDLALARLPQP